ncbi:MAG: hypothetical protein FWC67_00650 [Defluviitaleaceae bacterium]|nr:hypothetical protein [Defluviitaleaceae bacterium]
MISKENLLEKAHSLQGSHEIDKIEQIKSELLSLLGDGFDIDDDKHIYGHGGHDTQIIDALLLMEIFLIETKYNDLERCFELAGPVFERFCGMHLARVEEGCAELVDFYNLRTAIKLIGHIELPIDCLAIITPLTDELEEYKDHPRYLDMKMALHTNLLLRLLRMDKKEDRGEFIIQSKMFFLRTFNSIADLYEMDNKRFKLHKIIADIRKGIFGADMEYVQEGISKLKAGGHDDVVKIMETEIEEYFVELE